MWKENCLKQETQALISLQFSKKYLKNNLDQHPHSLHNTFMKIKNMYIKNHTQEHYPIYRKAGTGNPGRNPGKLGNTMRNLNVGDAFLYPHTTPASGYRLASQLGIGVETTAQLGGYWVLRVY